MSRLDLGRVKGTDGAAATVTVGTVTTGAAGSSASVVNSGTSQAAVLDFTIPKGDNGQGAIPDDSISGRNYTLGVANGKPYLQDDASPSTTTILMQLVPKHTWTETT